MNEPIQLVLSKFPDAKPAGKDQWIARCPAHDDHAPSLSIGKAPDGTVLLKCHANCETPKIVAAMGLSMSDLFPARSKKGDFNMVAAYDYTDADGKLLYQVVRLDPKSFRQRRPDPNGKDGWTWNLKGVQRVLYRLPEVLKAVAESKTIFIVEGEKDADNLARLGLVATTNAGGAGKWLKEYSECLTKANVVILPDNDDPGRQHIAKVQRSLRGRASSVRVINLPGLSEKGDVSEWLATGGTREELLAMVKAAKEAPPTAGNLKSKESDDAEEKGGSQTQNIMRLASTAMLFHDKERRGYATVPVSDHYETMPIKSGDFKRWIVRAFYRAFNKPPSTTALGEALGAIEAEAMFDGPELPVNVRMAECDGNIYLDLANSQWEVVEIVPTGWSVLSSAHVPVKFRRARGMLSLPRPELGGRLDDLRTLLGIADDRQWCLLVAWLVMAYRPRGPYPILGLHGEQGTGKSTRARVIRSILDPHSVPLRCEPKEARDLMIAANNSWCLALDNLSHLPVWLSDALCRLATGGGFGTRELYTNEDEQLFDSMRPTILTGIEAVATRPDLLDRSILLELTPIANNDRRTEDELFAAFEAIRAGVLGALLDAVACALKNQGNVKLPELPRMADFAKWVTAAEPALGWESGTVLQTYLANQQSANDVALDSYPIVEPLRRHMTGREVWSGTPTELLNELANLAGEKAAKAADWPKKANTLSGQLKRLASNLRRIGLDVGFGSEGRGRSKCRRITIHSTDPGDAASPSSPPDDDDHCPLDDLAPLQ